jgi:hypothetical protein
MSAAKNLVFNLGKKLQTPLKSGFHSMDSAAGWTNDAYKSAINNSLKHVDLLTPVQRDAVGKMYNVGKAGLITGPAMISKGDALFKNYQPNAFKKNDYFNNLPNNREEIESRIPIDSYGGRIHKKRRSTTRRRKTRRSRTRRSRTRRRV